MAHQNFLRIHVLDFSICIFRLENGAGKIYELVEKLAG